MAISRRVLMKSSAILAGAQLLQTSGLVSAWSQTMIVDGAKRIDVLSDGKLTLPANMLFDGLDPSKYQPILQKYGQPLETMTPDCNLTLYRDGTNTVLFDVGGGPNFMPTTGKIIEAFEALEVEPDAVTHVVFTHAHPDHLWGVLDDFDEPLFPNASYLISGAEWDYWTNANTVNTISEERQAFAAGANRLLNAIADNTSRFKFDEEVLPNISAFDTAGHTPGHTSFELKIGGESVVVIGDAIGNHHIQFEQPAWQSASDQDRDLGATARTKLIDKLQSEKARFIGYHFPYPGVGYAEKSGAGYRFIAAS